MTTVISSHLIIINPILIRVYPCKRGWPDLPHSNSNLSNSHSPSRSVQGVLLLQTNNLALILLLHLHIVKDKYAIFTGYQIFVTWEILVFIISVYIINELSFRIVKTILYERAQRASKMLLLTWEFISSSQRVMYFLWYGNWGKLK